MCAYHDSYILRRYVLGNAHTTIFFALAPQPETVVAAALECYSKSEEHGGGQNPDLFFSRAQVKVLYSALHEVEGRRIAEKCDAMFLKAGLKYILRSDRFSLLIFLHILLV